jgi:hypothetical protein
MSCLGKPGLHHIPWIQDLDREVPKTMGPSTLAGRPALKSGWPGCAGAHTDLYEGGIDEVDFVNDVLIE